MSFVDTLAERVAGIGYRDLPADTVAHAAMTVASSLAAGAVGQRSAPVGVVRELVVARRAVPEAAVWFTGERATLADATRLNHMAADESMADDSALMNGSHLGSAVTSAALAVAEFVGASGPTVLTAIVAGYEAAVRIGRAERSLRPERHTHVSGLNAFGCAATAAVLLGSSSTALASALCLAATGAGGVDRVSTNGGRPYQAGTAAANGVDAALCAHAGYRVPAAVMDRYLDLVEFDGTPTGRTVVPAATGDAPFALDTELILKLRPGPFLYGAAVEAALRVVLVNDLKADDIEQVTVRGRAFIEETDPRPAVPAGSLIYNVASAMARRTFHWDHFAAGADAAIDRLCERVRIHRTTPEDAPGTWGWAAEVTATTRDGRTWRSVADLPPGAVVAGLDWAPVEAKVHALLATAGVPAGVSEGVIATARTLPDRGDLAALWPLLR